MFEHVVVPLSFCILYEQFRGILTLLVIFGTIISLSLARQN